MEPSSFWLFLYLVFRRIPVASGKAYQAVNWAIKGGSIGLLEYFWAHVGSKALVCNPPFGVPWERGGVQGSQTNARALGEHDHRAANMDA